MLDLLKSLSLPLLVLSVYALVRLLGFEPEKEGLGDHVTALWLVFGASVSYLGFLESRRIWWWVSSLLFLTMATDEVFMIHETISEYFHCSELWVFGSYAVTLALLVSMDLQLLKYQTQGNLLVLFGILMTLALASDQLTEAGEYVQGILGHGLDVEQVLECLAALAFSSAFAVHYLEKGRR